MTPSLRTALAVALTSALALAGCDAPVREAPVLRIGEVQGSGAASPHLGAQVEVEGVVSAAFADGLDGFFLQSAADADDGDPATSEGLFVAGGQVDLGHVRAGQRLRVRGEVVELGPQGASLTTLRAHELTDLGRAVISPVRVDAAPADPQAWSRLEGMLVRVDAPLTVTGHAGLLRFGELVASFDGRLYQPTELHPPGPEAAREATRQAGVRLLLDDGSDAEWPAGIAYLPTAPDAGAPLRVGSVLGPVTGVIDRRRGQYRLIPTQPLELAAQAERPAPPQVSGGLRVAALNLENLFNGDGRGGGFPTERGAPTPELFAVQQAKLVATLQALDADIAALSEIENDGSGPRTALAGFVDALNASGPARDWVHVDYGQGPGTDAIRVGLVYRSSRVVPVGAPLSSDAPAFAWGSRPPLGQAFEVAGGGTWLVVANHFKSKGGCPEPGHPEAGEGDADQGDGQACWNAHRVAAAEALAEWIDTDPAGIGSENTIILGDLNSYGQEDPLRALHARGWHDALLAAGLERPYSYVFNGQAGRLDHALIHHSRVDRVRDAAIWNANADEHTGFGYENDASGDVWRSSDHDPLVLGIDP